MATSQRLSFPADVSISLFFLPLQPFGKAAGGGLTARREQQARVFFNANTGQHFVESNVPLEPLVVEIEEPSRKIEVAGNCVTIKEHCTDAESLENALESLYF